ncbi:UNVERIFIED_CONTAM: Best3 [Trichonephila clavipes]
MTVSYSLDVSKARFCGFTKLLVRWKGSIYKILWREFLIFCLAYAILSFIYRRCLDLEQKVIKTWSIGGCLPERCSAVEMYVLVVTIATYMYCIALIIGRQYLDPLKGYPKNDIDLYVPFFTLLQFFFYVGWLKVRFFSVFLII